MSIELTLEDNIIELDGGFDDVQQISDGGYDVGYEQGYDEGLVKGYTDGQEEGYERGYGVGYEFAHSFFRNGIANAFTELTAEDLEGVTEIGDFRFYTNKKLKSIEMADTITKVGSNAFYTCSMTSCKLSRNLVEIGLHGFSRCYYLEWGHLVLPDTLQKLDNYAFWFNYKLTGVTIPQSVISMGLEVFNNAYIETVIMKSSVPPTTGKTPFYTKSLKEIIVPKGSIDAYKSAENWSDYADYFVEEQRS